MTVADRRATVRQERDRVPRPAIYAAMGALAILLLAGAFATWLTGIGAGARTGWRREAAPVAVAPREIQGVEQTLFGAQVQSPADEEVRRELSTYGWTDRTAGRVRIPIERAMDIVAERGHVE